MVKCISEALLIANITDSHGDGGIEFKHDRLVGGTGGTHHSGAYSAMMLALGQSERHRTYFTSRSLFPIILGMVEVFVWIVHR